MPPGSIWYLMASFLCGSIGWVGWVGIRIWIWIRIRSWEWIRGVSLSHSHTHALSTKRTRHYSILIVIAWIYFSHYNAQLSFSGFFLRSRWLFAFLMCANPFHPSRSLSFFPIFPAYRRMCVSAFNNFRHSILSWVRCQIECNVKCTCVCMYVCQAPSTWKSVSKQSLKSLPATLCMCAYLYGTHLFRLSVARKSHLYHCIWHFPFSISARFPLTILALATRQFLPPNKPEGSKFLNTASQAEIQRFRLAHGHEAVMLTAVFHLIQSQFFPVFL